MNKTMLKALLAAAANRPTYTSDFPDVIFRVAALKWYRRKQSRFSILGFYVFCIRKIGKNPKIWQLWRPVAPQPYVVRKSWPDARNYLALGLQRGVNSMSLQCITWPVACSEWDACLTDFDRSSTFRFSGSGIRTMIRIGLKNWSVRPRPDSCRHAKFHPNQCTRFF